VYSLIIPVYGNELTLPALLNQLETLCRDLDGDLEVVFVVDGSPDDSRAILGMLLPEKAFRSQLVELSRNFGSFAAIRAGLNVARGPYCAILSADLQEPISLVREFFRLLRFEDVDIVVGQRTSRADPLLSRAASRWFWAFYRRFVHPEIPSGGVDVFGCSDQVRKLLVTMSEAKSSLIGLLFWAGFRRRLVPYTRAARGAGRSGWTLRRKLSYMGDSVFAFSDLPIKVIAWLGILGTALSMGVAIIVLTTWLLAGVVVPGYTPIMLALSGALSILLLAIGVLGSYVWRIFENTKQRPLSIIRSIDNFGPEPTPPPGMKQERP